MFPNQDFKTGVINPVQCFQEGWELIKNRYWLFFGISLVGILLGSIVPFGVILGAMMCGIYYCLFKQTNNQPVEFGDLFKGFEFFVPALIVTLFVAVPSFLFGIGIQVAMIPMQFAVQQAAGNDTNPFNALIPFFVVFGAVSLVFGLLISCIHALIIFAYPLIVERKMSGLDAFKLSARAVWANLGGVIGLILCQIVLGFIGVLLCYVGIFFIMPINFAGVFVAYRKVFPPVSQPFGINYNVPPPPPQF